MITDNKQTTQQVIDDYFQKDGNYIQTIKKYRKSTLLRIISDLKYLLGITPSQEIQVSGLTLIEIILTGFDMLARVRKHRIPANNFGKFFKEFLRSKHCSFTHQQAEKLWELRNAVLHSYCLGLQNQAIDLLGPKGKALKISSKNTSYYLIPLYSKLVNAKNSLYENICTKEEISKRKYAKFIESYCFYYKRN